MAAERKASKILDLILRNDGDPNLQLKNNGTYHIIKEILPCMKYSKIRRAYIKDN